MLQLRVVQQEMSNDQIVVRNAYEDFTTKSQLIVYESQEALFYKNGQALDLFQSGRHTLNTGNLPLLRGIIGAVFGDTPFPCVVYFINKVNVLDIIWGTDNPIEVDDPKYPMIVGVRANGQMGIRVTDSRKFVIKVVGQLRECTVENVRRTIKAAMMTSIKECIHSAIMDEQISILEITSKLSVISERIQKKINGLIADLGIEVDHFFVSSIMASDGDLDALRQMRANMMTATNEANMEAYRIRKISEARAQARAMEGYTYQDERRFDVLEGAAKNEGGSGGSFVNLGVGMGVGMGVGREVGRMTENMTAGVVAQPAAAPAPAMKTCAGCGGEVAVGAKFCPNCGQPQPQGPRFCPECGTRCEENSKFCANCGTKLG